MRKFIPDALQRVFNYFYRINLRKILTKQKLNKPINRNFKNNFNLNNFFVFEKN